MSLVDSRDEQGYHEPAVTLPDGRVVIDIAAADTRGANTSAALLIHEFAHELEITQPELYQRLRRELRRDAYGTLRRRLDEYTRDAGRDLSPEQQDREAVARLFEDAAIDPQTGATRVPVLDAMLDDLPRSMLERLLDALRRFVRRFRGRVPNAELRLIDQIIDRAVDQQSVVDEQDVGPAGEAERALDRPSPEQDQSAPPPPADAPPSKSTPAPRPVSGDDQPSSTRVRLPKGFTKRAVQAWVDDLIDGDPRFMPKVEALEMKLSAADAGGGTYATADDTLTIHPDLLDGRPAQEISRIRLAGVAVGEDGLTGNDGVASETEILAAVDEALGGRKRRRQNAVDAVLRDPESFDGPTALTAYLYDRLHHSRTEAGGGLAEQTVVEAEGLKPGDRVHVHGAAFDVVADGPRRLLEGDARIDLEAVDTLPIDADPGIERGVGDGAPRPPAAIDDDIPFAARRGGSLFTGEPEPARRATKGEQLILGAARAADPRLMAKFGVTAGEMAAAEVYTDAPSEAFAYGVARARAGYTAIGRPAGAGRAELVEASKGFRAVMNSGSSATLADIAAKRKQTPDDRETGALFAARRHLFEPDPPGDPDRMGGADAPGPTFLGGLFDTPARPEPAQEPDDAARPDERLESDRGDAVAGDAVGATDVRAGSGPAGDGAGGRGDRAGRTPGRAGGGDRSLFDGAAEPDGAPGDQRVDRGDRQPGDGRDAAPRLGPTDVGGDADAGAPAGLFDGDPPVGDAAGAQGRGADTDDAGAAPPGVDLGAGPRTPRPAGARGDLADAEAIARRLPTLYPDQVDDVVKAEARLEVQGERGILFTNGTGTGKTFTGLGVIRRHMDRHGDDVIVLVPTAKKAADWVADGGKVGVPLTELKNTRDAGRGAVVTTYANFSANEALGKRRWTLIVPDESHFLLQNEGGQPTTAMRRFRHLTAHGPSAAERARELSDDYQQALAKHDEETHVGFVLRQRVGSAVADRDFDHVEQLLKIDDPDPAKYTDPAQAPALYAAKTIKAAGGKAGARRLMGLHRQLREDADALARDVKAVFLSASPFAYHPTLEYAEGFVFDFPKSEPSASLGYNAPDGREQFYLENFGYRMRYNKLTKPESGVDQSVMERRFYEKLRASGAVSGRQLSSDRDYSRDFVLVDSGLGRSFDAGVKALHARDGDGDAVYPLLAGLARKRFDYTYLNRLYEVAKANASLDRVREHVAMGRQVVIFHQYKTANIKHPFRFTPNDPEMRQGEPIDPDALREEIAAFEAAHPELVELSFGSLRSVPEIVTAALGDAVRRFNGDVSKRDRLKAVEAFQDDGSGVRVLVVQMQAGKEGISLHDTTGAHQRALMFTTLAARPTDIIQGEGRIFRLGNQTDAVIEHLVLGLDTERWAFGSKINQRARTAENLAMGNDARDLERSIREGFLNATEVAVSDAQGTGGKAADRADLALESGFDVAISDYYARQKGKSTAGVDFFATPEPLGFKMVEWLDARPGDKLLEPSAGDGAIARYFPERTDNTFVEPSIELGGRLAVRARGAIRDTRFEDLNPVNKYDGIAMNPPFGAAGKTAMDHVAKAFNHLRDGGRLVAIVPDGPAMNKRLEKWQEATQGAHTTSEIALPASAFERVGTKVRAKVLVIDRHARPDAAPIPRTPRRIETDDAKALFERLRETTVPARTAAAEARADDAFDTAAAEAEQRPAPGPDRYDGTPRAASTPLDRAGLAVKATATKKGTPVWEVSGKGSWPNRELLKRLGGRWYRPARSWSFYDGDPTASLEAALQRGGFAARRTMTVRSTSEDYLVGPSNRDVRTLLAEQPDHRKTLRALIYRDGTVTVTPADHVLHDGLWATGVLDDAVPNDAFGETHSAYIDAVRRDDGRFDLVAKVFPSEFRMKTGTREDRAAAEAMTRLLGGPAAADKTNPHYTTVSGQRPVVLATGLAASFAARRGRTPDPTPEIDTVLMAHEAAPDRFDADGLPLRDLDADLIEAGEKTNQPLKPAQAKTRTGRRLLVAIQKDANGRRVGMRSIVRMVVESTKAELRAGGTNRRAEYIGDDYHVIRMRSDSWQLGFHEAGHAIAALLNDRHPSGELFGGLGDRLLDQISLVDRDGVRILRPDTFASRVAMDEAFAEWVRLSIVRPSARDRLVTRRIEKALRGSAPEMLDVLHDARLAFVAHARRPAAAMFTSYLYDKPRTTQRAAELALNGWHHLLFGVSRGTALDTRVHKPVFNAIRRHSRRLARSMIRGLESTPGDVWAAHQMRIHVPQEVQRSVFGVKGGGSIRVLATGDDPMGPILRESFTPERYLERAREMIESGRAEGDAQRLAATLADRAEFAFRDAFKLPDTAQTTHGNYIELHQGDIQQAVRAVGRDRWAEFETYGLAKAELANQATARKRGVVSEYPGRTEGIGAAELQEIVATAEAEHPGWAKQFAAINRYMNQLLLVPVLAGEITPDQATQIVTAYGAYWPLHRLIKGGMPGESSPAGAEPSANVMPRYGSPTPYDHVLESIERRTRWAYEAYYANRTMWSMVRLGERVAENKALPVDVRAEARRLMVPVDLEWGRLASLSPDQQRTVVADALNQQVAARDFGGDAAKVPAAQRVRPDDIRVSGANFDVWGERPPKSRRERQIVAPSINGERRFYEVADPILYEFLAQTARPHRVIAGASAIMRKAVQPWKRSITQTWPFVIWNVLSRDPSSAVLLGRDWKPYAAAARGLLNRIRRGVPDAISQSELLSKALDHANKEHHATIVDEFLAVLGEGIAVPGYREMTTAQRMAEAPGQAMAILLKPVDVLNYVSGARWAAQTTESLTREGAFVAAKKQGRNDESAQRDYDFITGNFGERGTPNVAAVFSSLGFVNPAAQILVQTYRMATNPEDKRWAAQPLSNTAMSRLSVLTIMGAVTAAVNHLLIDEEDREFLRERRDEDRLSYMALRIPFTGDRVFLRLPFDYGPAGAATSLGYNLVDTYLLGQGMSMPRARAWAHQFLRRSTDLIGLSDLLGPYAGTWRDLYANQSSFTGSAIVPEWMVNAYRDTPELQAFADTPEVYRVLARHISPADIPVVSGTVGPLPMPTAVVPGGHGVSPLQVQFAMRNVLSSQTTDTLEAISAVVEGEPIANELADLPYVGRLFHRTPDGWRSRSVNALGDLDRQYQDARRTVERMEADGVTGDAYTRAKAKLGTLRSAHFKMRDIRKLAREISDLRKRSPRPTERINELEGKMVEVARAFLATQAR